MTERVENLIAVSSIALVVVVAVVVVLAKGFTNLVTKEG